MKGMCSKFPITRDITIAQLLGTAVRPGNGWSIVRPITTTSGVVPSAISRVRSSLSSSSCVGPGVATTKRLAAAGAATVRGGRRCLSSPALTQNLCSSRDQVLRLSASEVSNRRNITSTVGRVSVSKTTSSVGGVSLLSSSCLGNIYRNHFKTQRLLCDRNRGILPAVVPATVRTRRTKVCRWGLRALSYRRCAFVGVEGKSSSSTRGSCENSASLSRLSVLSGKKASGIFFERMELFKPQLMDTMPFRFLSEYHSVPPRAVKDAISPIFFFGFGQAQPVVEVVQAGDPVLHEPAAELRPEEIGTARIEKIINDMVATMRNAPGVGLAAPQIGVNLQIIVLEDTKELMSYSSPEECEAQQRYPFDLLVIINPKLKSRSGSGSAIFFEGCLSVEGYRALVERDLEVEVTGLGRDGRPIRVEASGWKARILQHECDHLAGSLYVDKMVPKTFRTKENLRLPLPAGCPKQGVCKHSSKSLKL